MFDTGLVTRVTVSTGFVTNHAELATRSSFLRAVLGEMPELSTLEATGESEEIIHLSQLWASTALVRRASRLVFSNSVGTITLQLQPHFACSFRGGPAPCHPSLCRHSHPCPAPLARPLLARLEVLQYAALLRLSECLGLPDMSFPLTIVVLEIFILIIVSRRCRRHCGHQCRGTQSYWTRGSPGQNLDGLEEIGEFP